MKKIRWKCILAAAVLLLTAACGQGENASAPETPETPETSSAAAAPESAAEPAHPLPGVDAGNYPRVDGSTANMPLMARMYSAICGVSQEDGETAVEVTKTGPSWRHLADGETDLLVVYEPSESVRAQLEEIGTELEVSPLGRDGLVFLVNEGNQVENLTQEQLQDIYTGKITDWSGVGAPGGEITAFQRNEGSGSQTLFLKLLMKDQEPMQPPMGLVPGFMSDLIDGIAEYDGSGGAIGYSVFYYAKEMYANPDVRLISVDGVMPSAQTIGDGTYPLLNDFYVAIRADEPQDSPARLLRDWLLSDSGRDLMVEAGYVPVAQS